MRRLGWTYSEIRRVIPVPKGTLAGWCREIRLTEEQVRAIQQRTRGRKGVPRDTQRKRRQQIRRIEQEARALARANIDDPIFVAGVVLYWAEGDKSLRRLCIANTDPRILTVFIRWLRTYHDPAAEFVLALHLHEGNDEEAAKAFWRRALSLPEARFTKTFIKPRGTGHRKNHLRHGVCRVLMRKSTDPWIRTMAWIKVVGRELS